MTRIALLSDTARIAIGGLLLGASSIATAQEFAPAAPIAQPVIAPQPEPVAVAPAPEELPEPTAVPELQGGDSVAPAALGDIALESSEKRVAARERNSAARSQRQATAPASAASVPVTGAVAYDAPVASVESSLADTEIAAEPVAVAPIENNVAGNPEPVDNSLNDWLLIASIVGATGLAGGAALAANRRRRVVQTAERQTSSVPLGNVTSDTRVWAAMPVSAPVRERAPALIAADPVFAKPASFAPSTDPLFAPRATREIPVTDPLFAAEFVVPPVTDPMFAHLQEYEGSGATREPAWAFDARRNWPETAMPKDDVEREAELVN